MQNAPRRIAVIAAAVLAAGLLGLAGSAMWPRSDCTAGPTDRALAASADLTAGTTPAGHLRTVGVQVAARWSLVGDRREQRGGEWEPWFTAAAVTGDLVVIGHRPEPTGWFGSDSTVLAAYDARTGATRWQIDGPAINDTPFLLPGAPGQLLLFDKDDGDVTAVDAATGTVAWCTDTADDEWGAEIVAADAERIVLTSHGDGSRLRALDTATGNELWDVAFEAGSATPVLAGDVVLGHAVPEDRTGNELRAYDVATGTMRWAAPAHLPPDLAAGRAAAVLATTSGDGRLVTALDPHTGEPKWLAAVGTDGGSTPRFRVLHVLDEGVLVAVDSELVLLDAATGATRWAAPGLIDSMYASGLLVLQGPTRLLVSGSDQLAAVDVATGAVTPTPTEGEYVITAARTGDVVVTLQGPRVTVLTAGP